METSGLPAQQPAGHPSASPRVVILSGLSGGGKTAAAKLCEDVGYTVVDNLPAELLPDLAALVSADHDRFAQLVIVLDVRAGNVTGALATAREALQARGIRSQVVYLEARDDVLVRRYSETRHRHPLGGEQGIASAIAHERRLLEPIRAGAQVILDTSDLSLRELRERLFAHLDDLDPGAGLAIQLISFGYKYGLPLEADLVFDVRFMKNPFYVEELRELSGLTDPVREYVMAQPLAVRFMAYLQEFLEATVPAYVAEGKTRLTLAIGCTGGYHRSIVMVDLLAGWLRSRDFGPVAVFHRELGRR